MSQLYRIRVKRPDIEVEVESTSREYVDAKLKQYLAPTGENESVNPEPPTRGDPTSVRRPISVGEFIRRVNPAKKNEVAAAIAYFLEFHLESPLREWTADEVADRFTDVRKSRPANMTDLLVKSTFFMDGREKGTYRLSETGVQWVEERLVKNAS